MPARHRLSSPRIASHRPALAGAVVAALAGTAAAQPSDPNPYYLGVSQGFTYESNVYRTPDGASDTYSSTGIVAGFDQPIARQRVYGAADLKYNKYLSESSLDNTSYGLTAGLDWRTVGQLSGNVNVGADQRLASIGGNEFQPTGRRNIARSQRFGTGVRWGEAGPLSLDANYGFGRTRFSDLQSLTSESDTHSASVGVSYRLGADLRAGVALRGTRSETPYAVPMQAAAPGTPIPITRDAFSSNVTTGRNIDFIVGWTPTAQLSSNTRLSYTRQTNTALGARDFSGLTGSVSLGYVPTAKTRFNLSAGRDVGSQLSQFTFTTGTTGSTIVPVTSITGVGENRTVTDSLAFDVGYQATAKIEAKLALALRRAKIVNSFNVGGAVANEDASENYRTVALSANWAISRNWSLGCVAAHDTRRVTGRFGFGYSANTIGCTGQYTIR